MKLLLYNKYTGIVTGYTDGEQTVESYLEKASEKEQESTEGIYLDEIPADYYNHKINNGKLVKMEEIELTELKKYGKILTEVERLELKLLPSREEIEKAKRTLEYIELLREVLDE